MEPLAFSPGDDVACGLCHRDIDHAAIEQDAGVTLGDGCVERLDQPATFRDLRRLAGLYSRLAGSICEG